MRHNDLFLTYLSIWKPYTKKDILNNWWNIKLRPTYKIYICELNWNVYLVEPFWDLFNFKVKEAIISKQIPDSVYNTKIKELL